MSARYLVRPETTTSTPIKRAAGARRSYVAHAETNDNGSRVRFTNYGDAEMVGAFNREYAALFAADVEREMIR